MSWRTDWVERKRQLALCLSKGEAGGGYAEAVLVLTAVISTLAADAWPGRDKIDRKRFNELLIKLAPASLGTSMISIPLLIAHLRKKRRQADADKLAHAFNCIDDARILTGQDVDQTEDAILKQLPGLGCDIIRNHSYANLLYEEVRSAYAHGYQPGSRSDAFPMTSQTARVSYTNWVNNPDRSIFLHIEWISELLLPLANSLDAAQQIPIARPGKWWIEG